MSGVSIEYVKIAIMIEDMLRTDTSVALYLRPLIEMCCCDHQFFFSRTKIYPKKSYSEIRHYQLTLLLQNVVQQFHVWTATKTRFYVTWLLCGSRSFVNLHVSRKSVKMWLRIFLEFKKCAMPRNGASFCINPKTTASAGRWHLMLTFNRC